MSRPVLWTSDEAASATRGRSGGTWCARGVSIDSRTLERGDLFVALQGPSFDGHDFVAAAFERGAAAALVSRAPAMPGNGPLLHVSDTMGGLEDLARAARARCRAKVVAVTGSVGKTGTKEALRQALAAQGATHASGGNLNNHWGVPLSLARMPADTEFAVLEAGMNHAGELTPLSAMIRPQVAIITNVEPVHLEFFSSVSAIADAKAEILSGLEPGGVAVLNRDNAHFERLREAAAAHGLRVLSFGRHEASDVRMLRHKPQADHGCVAADVAGRTVTYRIGAPGDHWALNSLAVLAAVEALGADLPRAAAALADVRAAPGRGGRRRIALAGGGHVDLIDESYNASPPAVRAAITLLAAQTPDEGGRRIAVLGDMLELGEGARELHAGLADDLVAAGIDRVFACGPHMAALFEALPAALRGRHAADSEALTPLVKAAVRAGDVVMVKGSLGSRMAPVVAALSEVDPAPAAGTGR